MDDTEFSALRERAELGDKVALKGLANLARNKDYIALDELAQLTGEGNEKAAKELKQLAAEGYADSQILYWVGLTLLNKGDIEKPDDDTIGWFATATELGNNDARGYLELFAYKGVTSAQRELDRIDGVDPHRNLEVLTQSAEEGDDEALEELLRLAENGNEEALEVLEQLAADDGIDSWGCCHIGSMYYYGEGVRRSYAKAAEWFGRAAEMGDARAQAFYGTMLLNGKGVNRSVKKAAEWFRRSAEMGDEKGQLMLGFMYLNGKGVTQSDEKAEIWLRKSAGQGNSDAQYLLGILLIEKAGGGRYPPEAVALLKRSADQKNLYAVQALADLHIEDATAGGADVEKLRESAEQGDADAQYRLGTYYLDGPEAEWRWEAAYGWVSSAARKGHLRALRRLEQDAERGNAFAQYELGMMLLNGEGVERSEDRAMELLGKAAEAGVTKAEPGLNRARAMVRERDARKKGEGPVRKGLKRLLGLRSRVVRIRVHWSRPGAIGRTGFH